MKSTVSNIETPDHNTCTFRLTHTNCSIANSIRRTILADIPTIVIDTSQVVAHINTTRLNSELLKQRLGQIPVFISNPDLQQNACDNYELVIRVKNETSDTVMITTDDFQIRDRTLIDPNKQTDAEAQGFLPKENVQHIFPKDPYTKMPIDFSRLRGKIANCIQPEELYMVGKFKIDTAATDGGYTVVSTATYKNTVDERLADEAEAKFLQKEREESAYMPEQQLEEYIAYKKTDFNLLDRARYYKPDSFDFRIVSIGVYTPQTIVYMATQILISKLTNWLTAVMDNQIIIQVLPESFYECTIPNDKYTLCKIIEYALFSIFFENTNILSYCSIKRLHPHTVDSVIRIATKVSSTPEDIKEMFKEAVETLIENYKKIAKNFTPAIIKM